MFEAFETTIELDSPLTDEQWEAIANYEFDYCDSVTFNTPKGKQVKFVKENLWIPCKKRLPEKEGFYLLTVVTETGKKVVIARPYNGRGGFCDTNNNKVIAWRNLPEPYVEE